MSEILELCLVRFDRERQAWGRFDGDSLAGIDPKELAVLPTAGSEPMNAAEWWNVKQQCEEARAALLAERTAHLATTHRLWEAEELLIAVQENITSGELGLLLIEQGTYSQIEAFVAASEPMAEPTLEEIEYAKWLEEAGR